MDHIKLTEEFKLAYRFITETNLNVFLTGNAGTGKTTFLKYLRQNSFKKMLVAAPTGVAAINAGGVTLHSLFHLPFTPFIPGKETIAGAVNSQALLSKNHFNQEKLNLFRNLELLVIDEASMVASHTVDAIDTILRSVRRRHRQPFGGVQVLFIGDLHQLQPVVKNDEWQFLRDYYPSIFFFDSMVLREHIPVMIELTEIFRQKDASFVNILNQVRNNDLSIENFDLLNTRLSRNYYPDDTDGYITLTTHNNQADAINRGKLQRLEERSQIFKAEISGDYPEQLYPADAQLELKEGAQVMFLKNDLEEKKYFNGKLGIITKLGNDLVKVKCKGETTEIEVKKHEWKNINYKLNKDTREITEEVMGSFSQYPLRLAWAITIHKSQGLTFDRLIIDSEKAFANGQVYVALSRCTSLEGLVLTSPINRQFLGAHQDLQEWKQKNQDEKNLEQKFAESRRNHIQQELQNIFTWTTWEDELKELNETLNEHKENLPSNSLSWLKELIEKRKELQEIADKFKEKVLLLCNENPEVEENQLLQQRVKDAAVYFYSALMKWKEDFQNHMLTTDTKKISKQIDASLEGINTTVQEILYKLNHCKNGFILDLYLKHGKKLTATLEKIQSSYAQNQEKNIIAPDAVHIRLYDMIADMRKRIAGERNIALYEVFSNATIKNVCAGLPATKEVLLKVKGFGKVKVKQYGDEVIELVHDYCDEHDIEPAFHISSDSSVKKKRIKEPGTALSNTVEQTLMLFKNGKSLSEIAAERNFSERTIEDHMAQAIQGGLVSIEKLMPLEEAKQIAAYFPENTEDIRLSAIKEKAPDHVSYAKLKMVLAWLQNKS